MQSRPPPPRPGEPSPAGPPVYHGHIQRNGAVAWARPAGRAGRDGGLGFPFNRMPPRRRRNVPAAPVTTILIGFLVLIFDFEEPMEGEEREEFGLVCGRLSRDSRRAGGHRGSWTRSGMLGPRRYSMVDRRSSMVDCRSCTAVAGCGCGATAVIDRSMRPPTTPATGLLDPRSIPAHSLSHDGLDPFAPLVPPSGACTNAARARAQRRAA